MEEPFATLTLWDYRRRVQQIYERAISQGAGSSTWNEWRQARDELFRSHPQSPLAEPARATFTGLSYFDYDPTWRRVVEVAPVPSAEIDLANSDVGATRFVRFGTADFEHAGTTFRLTLFWLDSYGGGVFLPFRDATNGDSTYSGGRYLLDSAKGADLGHEGKRVVIDFNYAYHPSCVHDPSWSCPLAPADNALGVRVEAGERLAG